MYWLARAEIFIGVLMAVALTVYALATMKLFFGKVPEGEIVAVMHGDTFHRFIGNIKNHWVDQWTGEVWRTKRLEDGFDDISLTGEKGPKGSSLRIKPPPPDLPVGFYGIYWIGWPPFASIYEYRFKWNIFTKMGKDGMAKKVDPHEDVGGDTNYSFEPHDKIVDSLYFQGAYGFISNGAETNDRVPIDIKSNVMLRVVNAYTALFGVKSGWLENVTSRVQGSNRDFSGSYPLEKLNSLKHEGGDRHAGKGKAVKKNMRSTYVEEIMSINDDQGNESIRRNLGVEVVIASFISYDITEGAIKEALEKSSTAEFTANQAAKSTTIAADAKAKAVKTVGEAENAILEKRAGILKGAPQLQSVMVAEEARKGTEAIADAIRNQQKATTLILNSPAMPTINVGGKDEKAA